MEQKIISNKMRELNFDSPTLFCPYCNIAQIPLLIGAFDNSPDYAIQAKCGNPKCGKFLILEYRYGNSHYTIQSSPSGQSKEFSEIVNRISSAFVEIFNEAYKAQQMGLNQICGVGYRKALEFLIKDYAITLDPDNMENIKSKMLGRCIKEDISDDKIKQVATLAAWIGNDETHYVRKFDQEDVKTLITLIDLTVKWIEREEETKELVLRLTSQH
ncbi:MAG: DUF4145 domain-containing protein [Bacteroidales bacterium]